MGDIICKFRVRTLRRGRGTGLRLYFDTGAPNTFLKRSVAGRIGPLHEIGEPRSFGGLGNGSFSAREVVYFEVRLLEFWCPDLAFVVEEGILGDDYDMLIGHNFMQSLNVRCDPRRHRVILDRVALRLAQTVR